MDEFLKKLYTVFDPRVLFIKFAGILPDVIISIITILIFIILWKVLKRGTSFFIKKSQMDLTAASFVQTTIKYSIITVGVITALSQVGINITSILTSIGILGITIGFAAKDALSNIISGIFIFWDRPFVINDLIEIEGEYGMVDQITLRTTRIITVDGKMLAIPNNTVVNQIVSSYTNFPTLRLDLDFTVGLNEDIGKIRKLLFAIVSGDDDILISPAPEIVVTALNDYNLGMQFRVWIKDERIHVAKRFDLREKIYETLLNAGVDMPLETIQLAPIKINNGSTN